MQQSTHIILFLCWTITTFCTAFSQTFEWAVDFEGDSTSAPNAVTVYPWGNVITTGQFTGIVDFDPSSTGNYMLGAVNGPQTFRCALRRRSRECVLDLRPAKMLYWDGETAWQPI